MGNNSQEDNFNCIFRLNWRFAANGCKLRTGFFLLSWGILAHSEWFSLFCYISSYRFFKLGYS